MKRFLIAPGVRRFGLGLASSSKPTPSSSETSKTPEVPASPPSPKKPDALMEALMGLDEDGLEDDEEVDFHAPHPATTEQVANEGDAMEASSSSTPTAVEIASINAVVESGFPESNANDEDEVNADADGNVLANTSNTENMGDTDGQASHLVQNESILSDIADDLANLDVVDDADGVDLDAGDFDDLGDFEEDDAELEDLENFLTQVSTK